MPAIVGNDGSLVSDSMVQDGLALLEHVSQGYKARWLIPRVVAQSGATA